MKNTIFQIVILLVTLGIYLPSWAQISGRENRKLSNNSIALTEVSTYNEHGEISTTLYPACERDRNLTQTISRNTRIFKASNLIVASNTISNGANVTYSAKNKIILRPGFEVYRNSTFIGILEGCEPRSGRESQSRKLAEGGNGAPLNAHQSNNEALSQNASTHREGISTEPMFSVAPNPFSSTTTLSYQLIKDEKVTLDIYTMDARHVKSLLNEPNQRVGSYKVTLNASSLPSGIYYAILRHGNQQTMKKIMITK